MNKWELFVQQKKQDIFCHTLFEPYAMLQQVNCSSEELNEIAFEDEQQKQDKPNFLSCSTSLN